jgi:hypothetical protein
VRWTSTGAQRLRPPATQGELTADLDLDLDRAPVAGAAASAADQQQAHA